MGQLDEALFTPCCPDMELLVQAHLIHANEHDCDSLVTLKLGDGSLGCIYYCPYCGADIELDTVPA